MSIIQQRERTHGFFDAVATVSQALKDAMKLGPYDELPDVHREALEMICVKMARVVCGDHNEPDHVRDIMGYAELVLTDIQNKKTASRGNATIMEMDPDEEASLRDDSTAGIEWGR